MIASEDIPRRMIFLRRSLSIFSAKVRTITDEIELIQAICEHGDTSVAGNKRCQICGKELVDVASS